MDLAKNGVNIEIFCGNWDICWKVCITAGGMNIGGSAVMLCDREQ